METETVVKDAREVFEGDSLTSFASLVDRRVNLKQTIKELEANVKELDDDLTLLMAQHDCDKVMHGRHKCQIISKRLERLDKELLMLNGVPVKVIEASMKVSHSSYLEVREIKDTKAATS